MKTLISISLILFGFSTVSAQISQQNIAQNSSAVKEAEMASVEVVKLFQQKKYAEALPFAMKALDIRIRESGKNHVSVARAWRNLAYVQYQLNDAKKAEDGFDNAFDIYEKNQPLSIADEKAFVELLETVAINQAFDGNLIKAEKKLLRAVGIREKVNGAESIESANTLLKLSELYQVLGENGKAKPLLRRSLEIKNKKLGVENDETEDVYRNLSCTLTKLGKKDELAEIKNKFSPAKDSQNDSPKIQSGVVNGKALDLVKPSYPAEARLKRISGTVNVAVTIDKTGKVIHACAESGAKELQRASELASYKSKFSPTFLDGAAVKVTGTIIYKFAAR